MKVLLTFLYKGHLHEITRRALSTSSAFPSYLQSLSDTHDLSKFQLINAKRIGAPIATHQDYTMTNRKADR